MCDSNFRRRPCAGAGRRIRPLCVPLVLLSWLCDLAQAQAVHRHDPFDAHAAAVQSDPFDRFQTVAREAKPATASPATPAAASHQFDAFVRLVNYQVATDEGGVNGEENADLGSQERDPCAAALPKPMYRLGIDIGLPPGELPTDYASTCLDPLRYGGAAMAPIRGWPTHCYEWDATCLGHRPLYFEEINLERHGYGCSPACLQSAASAAHFFGTVPALPYCIVAQCPAECVYTLGHYRPGSCPPWRHHWPQFDPLAAAAQGGALAGLILLIP